MRFAERVLASGPLLALLLASSGCQLRAFQGGEVQDQAAPSPFWIKIKNIEGGTVLKRFPKQSSELELRDEKCGIEANALVYLSSRPVKLQNGHYLVNRMSVPVGCHFSSGFVYFDHVAATSPNLTQQSNDDAGYKMKIKSNTVLKLGTGKEETMERATEKCGLYAGDVAPLLGAPVLFEHHYALILKNPMPGCQVTSGLVSKDAVEIIVPATAGQGEAILAFNMPAPAASRGSTMTLWATNYYLPVVDARSSGDALRTMDGTSLGPMLSRDEWCDVAMQGSVFVRSGPGSGHTYNFAGTSGGHYVDCFHMFTHDVGASKFRLASGKWGDGVEDYKLVPYRTIAVDPGVIPYGTLVYIPAARGTSFKLPDGSPRVHDGYFFAADTGGAINGNHIDVFIGTDKSSAFSWIKSTASGTFEAWILNDEQTRQVFEQAHL